MGPVEAQYNLSTGVTIELEVVLILILIILTNHIYVQTMYTMYTSRELLRDMASCTALKKDNI